MSRSLINHLHYSILCFTSTLLLEGRQEGGCMYSFGSSVLWFNTITTLKSYCASEASDQGFLSLEFQSLGQMVFSNSV